MVLDRTLPAALPSSTALVGRE